MGPQGWAVIAENAQRVAFGADFMSSDGMVGAGYAIFGGGTLTRMPGAETPDRAVAFNLTRSGTLQTRFGNKQQIGPNVFLLEYQNSNSHGVAFWQVISTGQGGFMVVLRTAQTATTPGVFEKRGAEAMGVARSLRCQVPNVLDKEYYHNSQTGENFWVSPSHDWVQNGPDGPG
jgi:hypothetical protein